MSWGIVAGAVLTAGCASTPTDPLATEALDESRLVDAAEAFRIRTNTLSLEQAGIVLPSGLLYGAILSTAYSGDQSRLASLGAGDALGHRLHWTEFVIARDLGWADPFIAGVATE